MKTILRTIALLLAATVPASAQAPRDLSRDSATPVVTMYAVTDLGDLGAGRSHGWDINALGDCVGWSESSVAISQAFRWSPALGMRGLGFPKGSDYSYGIAINDIGWIAGYAGGFGAAPTFSFVSPKGKQIQELPSLGGEDSWARDINNSGVVVGSSKLPSGQVHAVIWDQGVAIDLGSILQGEPSDAAAISDTGFIVGRAGDHPYVYDGVSVNLLPDLGGNGLPNDVNDAGVIVGSARQENGVGCSNCEPRAVMWKNGSVEILGVLAPPNVPFMSSGAYGVNSHEQVVGRSTTGSLGHEHGFIWDAAHGIRDLNDLVPAGWTIQWATGINDAGQIVAIGSFGTGGQTLALRLDPLP